MTIEPLPPSALRRTCEPSALPFETTAGLEDLPELPGQERALAALRFGVGLRAHDYNIFAVGPTGLGKHAVVKSMLAARAAHDRAPDDWCYVHDFDDRHVPRALRLPAGRAHPLQQAMEGLAREVRTTLKAALDGGDLLARGKAIAEELDQRHEKAVEEVTAEAARRGLVLQRREGGFTLTPARDGKALTSEEFEALPDEERKRLGKELEAVHEQLVAVLHGLTELGKDARARTHGLLEATTAEVVQRVVDGIRAPFSDLPGVLEFLDAVQRDLIEHAPMLLAGADEAEGGLPELPIARRYRVNVLTDHRGAEGAPIVYEDHPTYPNLFGRVEQVQVLGALLTDFNLIKPGALHRANGGYLLLDARKVLEQPFVWDALKRALHARQLRIQSPSDSLGLSSTIALDPAPIPLEVKVVLIGDRWLRHVLGAVDPELRELFKVQADFAEELPWDDEAPESYARLLAAVVRRERTRPLDRAAVARIVEEGARRAEDRQRLSIDLQALSDLVREANRWAETAGEERIGAAHVERALDERVRRADRPREELLDRIARGTLLVAVDGQAVGQVNGLSVLEVGDFAFGRPARITARVRVGKGHVLDVDREVELGGPLHSKGVLILQGFLGQRYAAEAPLSLSASLVFEQSYGPMEGDSASVAELCCLLSAIGEVPARQDVAVTGSVNQHGQVQPVGGVVEKVEGFFDACARLGLTGRQGVIVPRANLDQLMLRRDVVEACAAGRFRVWAASTIDEVLEVLTDLPAQALDEKVRARLAAFTEAARSFSAEAAPFEPGR